MLIRPKTLSVARQRTGPMLLGLDDEKRWLATDIERFCLEVYRMQEEHLFRVRGYSPCLGLLPMVVLLFRRHRDLKLDISWVEGYLWAYGEVPQLEAHGVRILGGFAGCSDVASAAKKICNNDRLRIRIPELMAA